MSVHTIYLKDGVKMMRPVTTREDYLALRDSAEQRDTVKAVRSGRHELKRRLVQMNYSCLPNQDGTLRGARTASTTVGMDIDHIGSAEQMAAVRERILERREALGLLMLERSARGEGYHLVFRRRPELSQEENLRWASQLLEVEYDAGAKDITRVFFTTTASADDLLWLEDEVFETTQTTNPKPPKTPKTPKTLPQPLPVREGSGQTQVQTEAQTEAQELSTPLPHREGPGESLFPHREGPGESLEGREMAERAFFKGIPYSSIIAEYWQRTGGEPSEGERNTRLHQLAANLRAICDDSEAWLLRLMPRYGLNEQEMRAIIHSACKEPTRGSRLMTDIVNSLSPKLGDYRGLNRGLNEGKGPDACSDPQPPNLGGYGGLPEMPSRLPKVVALLLSKTPEIYRPAVAHAIFPPLGAHLWRVRFRYIDNVMHEATFMNVLMAGTGAGKDCITQPINRIMADIRLRDAENLRREAEWKKEMNTRGANKDKRQRPEGLIIQEVDPDMTNPAFVMRMAEADEHFLYTKMNEIDQFDALRGSARGAQQFQIMCLAFDPDNRYGQTRVGTQSVTEKVCIRFNWNASTTIQKGQRYFSRVLTDGPISRINFCTIPEREIGADMPVYGTYDAQFDEALRPYIERLTRATGVVDCPQAFRLARRLRDECAEFARLSQSRVYENLSFRACVIAWLKACVLYILNDYRWGREIEDFTRWSLQYDLRCKMTFFGEAIENANRQSDDRGPHRGPRNLLELLPERFSVHDADLVRQANGMDTRGTRNMLSQWLHRGYVLQMTDDSYFEKVKKDIEH